MQNIRRSFNTKHFHCSCTYIEGTVLDLIEKDGIVRGVRYRQKGLEGKQVRGHLLIIGRWEGELQNGRGGGVQFHPCKKALGLGGGGV